MPTIANVASQYMSTMSGVSPTMGAARGYKAGTALRQRNQELQNRERLLDLSEQQMDINNATYLAKATKEQKVAALEKVGGMAMFADTPAKWEAMKSSPDWPQEMQDATFDNREAAILLSAKGKDYLELGAKKGKAKWEKQFKKREQAEKERHNLAMEKKKTGMSVSFDEAGNPIITTGSIDAPKGARTGLFKDLIAGQQGIDAIAQIDSLYEPEFLTYGGAAKGAAATVLNKMDPEKRSQFQSRRAAFLSAANKEFLRFRKWATGVAGGEKEMAEIKRATFSEDDSPQDFEAKLNLARSLQRRLNARSRAALAAGADNENAFKAYIKANPLEDIPTLQERGDKLESMGYDKDQVIELLRQEGYVQ